MGRSLALHQKELIHIAHLFNARGWCLATSGNFSVRLDADRILITASGVDKERMTGRDTVAVRIDAASAAAKPKPSAETVLHCALYRHDTEICAVLHTHSLHATRLSIRHLAEGCLSLHGYEMLKALSGVVTHEHTEIIPVFPNDQDMEALSRVAVEYLRVNPECRAFLIGGHGLYTWGRDLSEAKRHVEALEFLFECETRKAL